MSNNHKLWVEKYRPQTIDTYVFQNPAHRESFERMIRDKTIPNLLLAGGAGTGKTTLAQILIRAMELDSADVLTINASDDRGIDMFRENIKNFSSAIALGDFKIVHLEEADQLTPAAQMALKSFTEEVSDYVRFIATCNNVNKIIVPLRSRFHDYTFKAADQDDVAELVINILASERVKFDLDLVDRYITNSYPDIRKIIGTLQQCTINGVLRPIGEESGAVEYQSRLLDLFADGNWQAARKFVCDTMTADEWENLYRFIYTNIHKAKGFDKRELWEEAIIIIAEHLYKHTICADSEINCAAMLIRLGQLK